MKITEAINLVDLDNTICPMDLFGGPKPSYVSAKVQACNKLYELAVEAEHNNEQAIAAVYMLMYLEGKNHISCKLTDFSLSLLEKDNVKFIH